MKLGIWATVAPIALCATQAYAGEAVLYGDAPSWVAPVDFEAAAAKNEEIVVFDRQVRLEDGIVQRYADIAYAIRNSETLSKLGTLQFAWFPDKGDLTIHRLQIVRDGKVIDLLGQGVRAEVIRRETELERLSVNGALTALFKIPGIRIGDILRLSSTTSLRDQALAGEMQASEPLTTKPARLGFGRVRISWPENSGVQYSLVGQAEEPQVSDANGYRAIELLLPIAEPREMPEDAPGRFLVAPAITTGSFADWAEVASSMAPHYTTQGTIAPGSSLAAEVARIEAVTPDPLERAALALQSVQDDINYLLNGMNGGNYLPQSPAETWSLKYGDCKAKSLLLLAMLRDMGIEADAMLVNSENGDAVSTFQPVPGAFDHVIVRAKIDGKDYWLDGTSAGTRLDTVGEVPDFVWALPIVAKGAKLVRMEQRWPTVPDRSYRITYDLSNGVDVPGLYDLELETHGILAARMATKASETDPRNIVGQAQKFLNDKIPDSVIYRASYDFDADTGTGLLRAKGILLEPFGIDRDIATHTIDTATTNWNFDPDRARTAWRDIPYRVGGPMTAAEQVSYILPEGGEVDLLGTPDVAETVVAGIKFARSLSFTGNTVMVSDSYSYIPAEIAAADISAAKAAMRKHAGLDPKIRITGPRRYWELDDVEAKKRTAGLVRSADALVDLDDDEARLYQFRSAIHMLGRDYEAALGDLDKAIELDGSAAAHTARAKLLAEMNRFEDSAEDARMAFELSNDLETGTAYAVALAQAGRADDALDVLDRFDTGGDDGNTIAQIFAEVAGETDRRPEAWERLANALEERPGDNMLLNSQCWFIGTWAYKMEEGEQFCDKAVREGNYSAAVLDSRALFYHRLGRQDDALRDLNAALKKAPGQAASMYLRGIILLEKGEKQGKRDIEQAMRLSPAIAARYARYGIAPKG